MSALLKVEKQVPNWIRAWTQTDPLITEPLNYEGNIHPSCSKYGSNSQDKNGAIQEARQSYLGYVNGCAAWATEDFDTLKQQRSLDKESGDILNYFKNRVLDLQSSVRSLKATSIPGSLMDYTALIQTYAGEIDLIIRTFPELISRAHINLES